MPDTLVIVRDDDVRYVKKNLSRMTNIWKHRIRWGGEGGGEFRLREQIHTDSPLRKHLENSRKGKNSINKSPIGYVVVLAANFT